jgi:hypothetical protein
MIYLNEAEAMTYLPRASGPTSLISTLPQTALMVLFSASVHSTMLSVFVFRFCNKIKQINVLCRETLRAIYIYECTPPTGGGAYDWLWQRSVLAKWTLQLSNLVTSIPIMYLLKTTVNVNVLAVTESSL